MAKTSFDPTSLVQVGGAYGTVVAYGSVNVKGAWTQLTASSSVAAASIVVMLENQGGGFEEHLIDVGIGAVSSEVVLVANLASAGRGGFGSTGIIPVQIASGTRISVRGSRSQGNNALRASILLIEGPLPTSSSAETWGAVEASSKMTAVDPGATPDTKGSWVQLIASSGINADWLLVMTNVNNDNSTDQLWSLDIGSGAPASEVVRVPDLAMSKGGAQSTVEPGWRAVPIPRIPSGTRIAARCQSNTGTANDRVLNVGIIAVERNEPAGGGGGLLTHPGMSGGMRG